MGGSTHPSSHRWGGMREDQHPASLLLERSPCRCEGVGRLWVGEGGWADGEDGFA